MSKKTIIILIIIAVIVSIGIINTAFISINPISIFSSQSNKANVFLNKYCKKSKMYEGENTWLCLNINEYPGGREKFINNCESFNYTFKCAGNMCQKGLCYITSTKNKICLNSKECESKWCKPINEECVKNCTGECSEHNQPTTCSQVNKKKYKVIENGLVTIKEEKVTPCMIN